MKRVIFVLFFILTTTFIAGCSFNSIEEPETTNEVVAGYSTPTYEASVTEHETTPPSVTTLPMRTESLIPTATLIITPSLATTYIATLEPITPVPTLTPTLVFTQAPTDNPTATPTNEPTVTPTKGPTPTPTLEPTNIPTKAPTATPTLLPTPTPTIAPTAAPTAEHVHSYSEWGVGEWIVTGEDEFSEGFYEAKTLARYCQGCSSSEIIDCPFHIYIEQKKENLRLDGIYDSVKDSVFYSNGTVTIPWIEEWHKDFAWEYQEEYFDVPQFVNRILFPDGTGVTLPGWNWFEQ